MKEGKKVEVSIYINIWHRGNLRKGTGTYGIMLEYIRKDGTPATIEVFKGLKQTTKNRTALKACIEALENLTKQCFVILYINNPYVTEAFTQGWNKQWDIVSWTNKGKPIKNADLWQQLFRQMEQHKVKYAFTDTNPYTSYIDTMLKRKKIEYKEDKNV